MSRRPTIEVVPAGTDRRARAPHLVQLRASNGAVLATSEAYTSRGNALRATTAWVEAMRGVLHMGALGVVWPPDPPRIRLNLTPEQR